MGTENFEQGGQPENCTTGQAVAEPGNRSGMYEQAVRKYAAFRVHKKQNKT